MNTEIFQVILPFLENNAISILIFCMILVCHYSIIRTFKKIDELLGKSQRSKHHRPSALVPRLVSPSPQQTSMIYPERTLPYDPTVTPMGYYNGWPQPLNSRLDPDTMRSISLLQPGRFASPQRREYADSMFANTTPAEQNGRILTHPPPSPPRVIIMAGPSIPQNHGSMNEADENQNATYLPAEMKTTSAGRNVVTTSHMPGYTRSAPPNNNVPKIGEDKLVYIPPVRPNVLAGTRSMDKKKHFPEPMEKRIHLPLTDIIEHAEAQGQARKTTSRTGSNLKVKPLKRVNRR